MLASFTPLANRPFHLPGSRDRAVLFVHGLGGGPYELQRLAEDLADRSGSTMVGIHLPGHDVPGRRMPASTWHDWFAAVEAAHDDLVSRFARVDVVGFSLGGALALHLAANKAMTGRLVVLAPFLGIFRPALLPVATEALVMGLPFVRRVPSRAPPIRNREVRRSIAEVVPYRAFNLDATRSALDLISEVHREVSRVEAPTLIVQGRADTVVDPAGAATLYKAMTAETRLVWLDDSDHLLTYDRDAAEVHDEVAAYLLEAPAVAARTGDAHIMPGTPSNDERSKPSDPS
jgi:carboxylesterase